MLVSLSWEVCDHDRNPRCVRIPIPSCGLSGRDRIGLSEQSLCECAMMMKDYFPSCSQFSALEPTEGPRGSISISRDPHGIPEDRRKLSRTEYGSGSHPIRTRQTFLILLVLSCPAPFSPHSDSSAALHLDHRDGTNLRRCERRRTRASNNTMTTTPTISYLSGRWCTPSPLLSSSSDPLLCGGASADDALN